MTNKPVRVLVADDSADDCVIISLELRTQPNFELAGITHDGIETIAWLNATPPYSNREKYPFPDLLLLDYQMPGCSGLDVLQWLHHQQRRPAVILWSNAVELIDQAKAYHSGAAVVCAKPDSPSQLTLILARVFPESAVWPTHSKSIPAHLRNLRRNIDVKT